MALFGPQARLERCLWWAELTSWPHGASEERRGQCYDKVFGRAGSNGIAEQGKRLATVRYQETEPKNDLLTLALVVLGGFLVYKYVLKK